MDRSLWLLNLLRLRAWVRRWTRGVRTLKGVLLALVGSLLFLPIALSALLTPRVMTTEQLSAIRLYGPLGLCAYCVLNVVLSAGDRAVYYAPAEVNFLFSGPYRPRQLLLYKACAGIGAAFLTAVFMTLAFAHHAAWTVAAFAGLFFALVLLYLFSLAVGLSVSTAGALAFGRGRKALLLGIAAVIATALRVPGRGAGGLSPWRVLDGLLRSPAVSAALLPFRPFVMAFTAERLWPDLLVWSGLCLAVDLALLAVVLAMNARFLEASAAASTRMYARLRKARRGDALPAGPGLRVALPMPPWWGGAGPNVWRQLTAASRTPARLAGVFLLFLMPAGFLYLTRSSSPIGTDGLVGALPMFLGMAFVASSAVGYDFRTDLRNLATLKALPVRPSRLVLGQLTTPVLILSVGQWLSIALIGLISSPRPLFLAASAVLVPPVSLLMVAVENLYFLWYPYRAVGVNSFDVPALGRQFLLAVAKFATLGFAAALASGVGGLVFWSSGGSPVPTVGAAWVVVAACGLGLTPVLVMAFDRCEVPGGRAE